MLAARYYGIGDVRVEDIPIPACGPGEVLVKVAYAGICGSDLHVFRKGMFVTCVPVTMGHEFSGTVLETGAGVSGFSTGDNVAGDPRVFCGKCRWCRQGKYNLCPGLGFIGEVSPGCFAEYIVLDHRRLLKVPSSVDLQTAALVEPLAVALHISQRGKFSEKDAVGIIGAGPIGLLTAIVAKAVPVKEVAVIDLSPARLELAKKIGADRVLAAFPEDPGEQVDVAVEAAGVEAALAGALRWLRPEGRLVMAGLYEEKVWVEPNDVLVKELNITGINAYETSDLEKAVELLAGGKLDVTPVVSHVLPLQSAAEGFAMLTAPEKKASKVLLAPQQNISV